MLDEEMPPSEKKKFLLKLNVRETSSWKVVYCEEGKGGLTLRGTEGACSSGTEYSYAGSGKRFPGILSISAEGWLPSPGSGWVEVQGVVPLVFSREFAETEMVKLKTDKAELVPMVLKNAAPGGGDVKVRLRLNYVETLSKDMVIIYLLSDVRVGFPTLELQMDGVPLRKVTSSEINRNTDFKHRWSWVFEGNEALPPELTVSVRYAAGLKKVMVPVKMRAGLFGMAESFQTGGSE